MKILAVTVTPSRQLDFDETFFPDLKTISGKAAIGSDDDLSYTGFQAHKTPGSLFWHCLT
jgi:hypothetical protein